MPTILAIDDNLIALTARKKLLERAGYAVLTATEGGQGLRMFDSHLVDLVLMDDVPGCGSELRWRMRGARPQAFIVRRHRDARGHEQRGSVSQQA